MYHPPIFRLRNWFSFISIFLLKLILHFFQSLQKFKKKPFIKNINMEQSTYTYSSTNRCTSCTVKYYYCRKVQIIIPVSVHNVFY